MTSLAALAHVPWAQSGVQSFTPYSPLPDAPVAVHDDHVRPDSPALPSPQASMYEDGSKTPLPVHVISSITSGEAGADVLVLAGLAATLARRA